MTALPRFDLDCVVAGAGVIGLAIARELALAGRDVLIVEKGERIGSQTSSRNSEVIHAGLYYPPGSLKADTCIAGKNRLYAFLESRRIAHRRCGKLVVATHPSETRWLSTLMANAQACGLGDLQALTGDAARKLEPDLCADSAVLSPSSGIFDSHHYMISLLGEAEDHGARLALRTKISRGEALPDGRVRLICEGQDPCTLTARTFVNAAGLGAVHLARRMDGLPDQQIPQLHFAKGSYFKLAGAAPFRHLVYPVPTGGGLGIHLTLDLAGQARFGPDVEWVEHIDYQVDRQRAHGFYPAIRRYWSALPDGALVPDYAGIRPKISGPGGEPADFQLIGPQIHGIPGQIHLFGIESPGLTASLEIARRVLSVLDS